MLPDMDDPSTAPEGARLLRDYLARRPDVTLHAFCEAHELDYSQVHRLLSGLRGKRVSVNLAVAIQCATGGEVPCESWESPDAQRARTGTEG